MNHIHFSLLWIAQVESAADEPTLGVLIGFLILLAILILALVRGTPRGTPEIIDAQTPDRWTDGPVNAENRRKAAAAAIAVHLHAPRNPRK
jgi:Na+-transporting methylmalonyl-CoA/oxaloacetate decarboxylase gamma subunit